MRESILLEARPASPATRRWVRPVAAGTATALALAVAYLVAPPMGTDLSAQVARAAFAAAHGATPIDLSWYGGVDQFGYSLFSQALGAALGVRATGAAATVAWAAVFAFLLARTGARRPVAGAVLGAATAVANLVSGRTTFAVGTALALAALAALTLRRPARPARLALAAGLAALATWASPVAGLFAGLAGGTLLLAGLHRGSAPGARLAGWRPGPVAEGLSLCLGSALALAPMAVLAGDGGAQPFTAPSMAVAVVAAVVAGVVLPGRVLRTGAALTVLLLLAAFLVPSPIGSNALRLPMLFVLPLVAAYAPLRTRWLVPLLVALAVWQPPVITDDLARAGATESAAGFYRPLTDELARRGPVGRVEVVPLRDHWESAYVAPTVPLARGWQRQVDTDRNPLFYDGTLTADTYRRWLAGHAVAYVALADGYPPDRPGRAEAALVAGGLPYLTPVWRGGAWTLYRVADPTPLVAAPATLVASAADRVVFDVPAPADVLVRVRWSRWLTATGPAGVTVPAPGPGPDGWTLLSVPAPGRYVVGSALAGPGSAARTAG
jgi:hypothetical protein